MGILYMGILLSAAAAAVGAVVWLVRRLQRKNTGLARRFTGIMLGIAVLSSVLAAARSQVSDGLLLLAALTFFAAIVLLLAGIVKKCRGRGSRRAFVGAAGALALTLLLVVGFGITADFPGENTANDDYEISIRTTYDFQVEDGTQPLEVVTGSGFVRNPDSAVQPYRMVYDSCELYHVLENDSATAEDCRKALEANPDISGVYRTYFADFIRRIAERWPEANLSVLCENLKTLQVVELGKMEYLTKSLSLDSYGCYMRTENIIYIPEGTTYVEGEWGFQVLLHEFCHAARTRWVSYDDGKDRIQFCSDSDNTLLEESMNSVFSCSLLQYEERDIAYQVPSNYLRIMLECMDNYTLSDYINHSDRYFLKCLDEYNGDTNYAQVLWKLITLQRSDWEDDKTDIPEGEYVPIYAYLCRMYYGKYITPDMTDAACEAVAAELADKAFFDAPEGYKTDPDYFYTYLKQFRAEQSHIA